MGLIARHLEARGIPSVTLASMRTPIMRVKPPRALLVPGPRGRTVGAADDRQGQLAAVRAALRLLHGASEPGTLAIFGTDAA